MKPTLGKKQLSLLAIVTLLLLGGTVFSVHWLAPEVQPQAKTLYDKNCAVCHGPDGRGDGQAAFLLNPKPRNFRAGKYRLVTSQNLQPTRDDIFRTISNGMPGTGMPSWGHLPENDRLMLAEYVLKLNYDGYVERALAMGDNPAEAEQFARQMTTLSQPIPIPPEPPLTPAGLEEGRQLYIKSCANCHGPNGEGRRDPTWRTSEGYPTWSRNLREGVFKGGREAGGVYLRFHTGLPGTPMPSLEIPGEKVWRIVQYVLSLSDPSAQERATIKPVELTAKKVSPLPTGPDDPAWDTLPEVRVPLMPLWWIKGYVAEMFVKVAHDGQRVAFRLQWKDATHDVGGVQIKSFSDGAALQFATGANPPLFAMGATNEVCYFWHWKALWDEDRKTFQDVTQAFPNMVNTEYLGGQRGWGAAPLEGGPFLPARELGNAVARPRTTSVEEANAAGFGSYTAQAPKDQNVDGASSWKDGVWRVAFVRDLKATSRDDVALSPGGTISVAFAVWDGSVQDRNGQKTVSIWNTLKLEK